MHFSSEQFSEKMRLQTLVILLFQVAQLESLKNVSGYLGDSVTLPSGCNSKWQLSIIKWSIFPNSTWIATYLSGKQNTERIIRYKGRLSLNISSGDLTIHNLTKEDAMEYTVDLINTEKKSIANKIKLTVTQPLQKPTINKLGSVTIEGSCWTSMRCKSEDKGVHVSWQVNPPNVTDIRTDSGDPGFLFVILNSTQNHVQITCISKRNTETALSVYSLKCDDGKLTTQTQSREGVVFYFFGGVFLGVFGCILIYLCRGEIKRALDCISGKLCFFHLSQS